MKQMEVTMKTIGENTFYLKPFPAFVAVNISGELSSMLAPVVGSIAALVGSDKSITDLDDGAVSAENITSIMDTDIEKALPIFSQAFSKLSGDKMERIIKKPLVDHKNISVESEATEGKVSILTYELANEVFCGDIQDMIVLCFEVIKLNFGGFFKKLGVQFGSLKKSAQAATPSGSDGESSTYPNSQNSK